MKRLNSTWAPAITVAVLAMGSGGWLLQRSSAAQESAIQGARLFEEVHRLVSERYVEELDRGALYRMAIDGMLRELGDPYSVFIDADSSDDLELATTGNYGGLGIRIQRVGDWITVMGVLPNTPAEREGLMTGDRIVEVEGESARGWTDTEAVDRLRGPKGSPVTIRIGRVGVPDPLKFTIVRDEIHVVTIKAFLTSGQIGYVRLEGFSQRAREELAEAIGQLRDEGARAVVLDLRDNPGGLLDQGVAVSDLFLPRGADVVETRSRIEDQNFTFRAPSDDFFPGMPIVVLVNVASASASEIVAGSLQDHDRALIVGSPTFGKGSVQTVYALPGGHHLKLTTAGWYTPSGRSINRNWLEDDGAAEAAVAAAMEAVEGDATAFADTAGREIFYTAAGRPVYGGGGITPDVLVSTRATEREREFATLVARGGFSLRQLAFRFAVRWVADSPDLAPDFEVTPGMRDAFFRMLTEAEQLPIDATIYGEAGGLVDRYLAYQVTNTAFGETEALRRSLEDDPVFGEATRLLGQAKTAEELLGLLLERGEQVGAGHGAPTAGTLAEEAAR